MAKPKVVVRQQVGKSLIAKSAYPYRQNLVGEREHTEDSPAKKEVDTILGEPYKAGKSRRARYRYAQGERYPSRVMVHATNVPPSGGITSRREVIVFTDVEVKWVHHPHKDALVIMAKIANSLVHKILVHNGSTVNILYCHAYQKIRQTRANLSPTTSPLYGFIRDHVVPKGTIKLAVTLAG